ncbi:hypothetical protein PDJAM_G00106530 [Pangasius djambal]|uniref:Uncharacterized protein n=1 Tax=Pangasius djambal TaxID=1691987 RepID=A0ACC5Y1A6_9TELE|nr:hypothetical protein [Pangasius djambal]
MKSSPVEDKTARTVWRLEDACGVAGGVENKPDSSIRFRVRVDQQLLVSDVSSLDVKCRLQLRIYNASCSETRL